MCSNGKILKISVEKGTCVDCSQALVSQGEWAREGLAFSRLCTDVMLNFFTAACTSYVSRKKEEKH